MTEMIKQVSDVELAYKILQKTNKLITDTFLGTNLLIWTQMSFNEYEIIWNDISDEYFAIHPPRSTSSAITSALMPLPVEYTGTIVSSAHGRV